LDQGDLTAPSDIIKPPYSTFSWKMSEIFVGRIVWWLPADLLYKEPQQWYTKSRSTHPLRAYTPSSSKVTFVKLEDAFCAFLLHLHFKILLKKKINWMIKR
jgi:hypothetical protein